MRMQEYLEERRERERLERERRERAAFEERIAPPDDMYGAEERAAHGDPLFTFSIRCDAGDGQRHVGIMQGVVGRPGYKVHRPMSNATGHSLRCLFGEFLDLIWEFEFEAREREGSDDAF